MDDLLREFLVETGEHLDTVDVELVRLEARLRNSADHVAQNSLDGLEDALGPLLKSQRQVGQVALGFREIVGIPPHEEDDCADDGGNRNKGAEGNDQRG